jgi:hypothetical protein
MQTIEIQTLVDINSELQNDLAEMLDESPSTLNK